MGFSMRALELDIPKLPADCRRPRTSSPKLPAQWFRQKRVFQLRACELATSKLHAHCLRPRKSSHHNPKCYGCSGHCTAERQAKTQPAARPPPSNPPSHPHSSMKPNSSANAAANHCTDSIPPATGLSRIREDHEDRKRKRGSARDEKGPEFSLSLSKQEIQEDFLVITGAKPTRRPAKRPKFIQKQLNDLFPGVYLRL